MFNNEDTNRAEDRLFSWRRIKTMLAGLGLAIVVGLIIVNLYTYLQYGGTMFDRYFEKEPEKSPAAGKLAFDKQSKLYIGVVRGEGHNPRKGDVYIIEQPGGSVIDLPRGNIEIREPRNLDK